MLVFAFKIIIIISSSSVVIEIAHHISSLIYIRRNIGQ